MIFFETLEHSSQVTRLQGFEGYMVTELQNPPHILPYLGCRDLRLKLCRALRQSEFQSKFDCRERKLNPVVLRLDNSHKTPVVFFLLIRVA